MADDLFYLYIVAGNHLHTQVVAVSPSKKDYTAENKTLLFQQLHCIVYPPTSHQVYVGIDHVDMLSAKGVHYMANRAGEVVAYIVDDKRSGLGIFAQFVTDSAFKRRRKSLFWSLDGELVVAIDRFYESLVSSGSENGS